jgi:DNA-directed RNA polymerase specialized sigma subunit
MKNEMIFFEQDLISKIFEGVENPFDELAGEMKYKLVKSLSVLSDQEYLVLSLFHEEEMMNMKEIGEIMGLDEPEANLIRSKAILKLKTQFTPASL